MIRRIVDKTEVCKSQNTRHAITDLLVYHVADGHADLHAGPLDVVEVEVVEDGQSHGGQGDAGGTAVGLLGRSHVAGVVALKVLDDLAEEQRLNDLDGLLASKTQQH